VSTVPKTKFAFRVNDLVRIVEQPAGSLFPVQGLVGYIEEIQGPKAIVNVLSAQGQMGASGPVPLTHLETVTDPLWVAAKSHHDARITAIEAEGEARRTAWLKRVSTVAKRFGLSPKKVQDIYDLLKSDDMPLR
jgi:hypothetical protein